MGRRRSKKNGEKRQHVATADYEPPTVLMVTYECGHRDKAPSGAQLGLSGMCWAAGCLQFREIVGTVREPRKEFA